MFTRFSFFSSESLPPAVVQDSFDDIKMAFLLLASGAAVTLVSLYLCCWLIDRRSRAPEPPLDLEEQMGFVPGQ